MERGVGGGEALVLGVARMKNEARAVDDGRGTPYFYSAIQPPTSSSEMFSVLRPVVQTTG